MQLSRFSASKVFGYLDFDFEIEHLAFLIGPNGSGKSTALHLMESVLTPSLRDLAFIKFESVELTFIDVDESRKTVRVYKGARNLKVSADWISESLDIPDLGDEKAQLLSEDSRSSDEYFRSLSIHLSSHPAFKAIAELPAPVFLGIDRRHRAGAIREAEPNEPSGFQLGRRGIHARRILTGNLAAGLSETQLLIQEAYRTARKKMDSYQQRLRNNVLLSAFHYSELQRDEDGSPNFDELEPHKDFDVLAVRQSIEKTLSDIGLDSDDVAQRISPFFEKLSQLIEHVSGDKSKQSEVLVEFLMNKGQLDRLQSLLAMVQDHQRSSDLVTRNISQFIETINWFFRDSGKRVVLDTVGRLRITRRDGLHIQLDEISSGERQLIIIFSHLFFNSFGSRSKVFVIDEPELSLHLRWQESLISKMREAAPGMQLIVATHSPDIVGEHEQFCIEIDKND